MTIYSERVKSELEYLRDHWGSYLAMTAVELWDDLEPLVLDFDQSISVEDAVQKAIELTEWPLK